MWYFMKRIWKIKNSDGFVPFLYIKHKWNKTNLLVSHIKDYKYKIIYCSYLVHFDNLSKLSLDFNNGLTLNKIMYYSLTEEEFNNELILKNI